MEFKFTHTEKIAGVFVFFALVIMLVGAVSIAVSKKVFVKTCVFKTRLADASGLSTSTPLSFKGYKIGRVKSFHLDRRSSIDVELAIYREFREKIIKGAAVYRLNNPITGDTSLVLLPPKHKRRPGTGESPDRREKTERRRRRRTPEELAKLLIPEGEYIPSLDMREGQELLEQDAIEKSGDTVALMFDEARVFVSNLRTEFKLKKDSFKDFFENLQGFSESLFRNKEMFDNLHALLDTEKGPIYGTMNQLLEVSKKLGTGVDQLNGLIENYKNPDGLMTRMLQVDQSGLNQAVENLNRDLMALRDLLESLREDSPLITDLLNKSRKTFQAINNNPLLRGGIEKEDKNTNSSQKKRVEIEEE